MIDVAGGALEWLGAFEQSIAEAGDGTGTCEGEGNELIRVRLQSTLPVQHVDLDER